VVAAMFAGVSSAQAATAGACVFTGLSGSLTPDIPPVSGDILPDVERGSYNFSTGGATAPVPATCAGVFNDVPLVDGVSITSSGFYDNVACGTGTAHDLDGNGTTVTGLTTGISITGAGYEIVFAGGNGALQIGGQAGAVSDALEALPDDPVQGDQQAQGTPDGDGAYHGVSGATGLDSTHEGNSSDFTGAGVVNITPVAPGNCVNVAVDEFEVAGFFVASDTP
jgi:hypothetical protein